MNMKVLVVLTALFVCIQAKYPSDEVKQRTSEALVECTEATGFDAAKAKEIMKERFLPEDNAEFTAFYGCMWKKMAVFRKDESFDYFRLKMLSPHYSNVQFPDLSEDDAYRLTNLAVEHCKVRVEEDSQALTAVKFRNCMVKHIRDFPVKSG